MTPTPPTSHGRRCFLDISVSLLFPVMLTLIDFDRHDTRKRPQAQGTYGTGGEKFFSLPMES